MLGGDTIRHCSGVCAQLLYPACSRPEVHVGRRKLVAPRVFVCLTYTPSRAHVAADKRLYINLEMSSVVLVTRRSLYFAGRDICGAHGFLRASHLILCRRRRRRDC